MAEPGRAASGPNVTSRLIRNEAGIITDADAQIAIILGWQPTELIGSPSTNLIHPEDQHGAIAAWFTMLASPGGSGSWEGRYRTAAGGWRWVHVGNVNHLDDPNNPHILTTLVPVDGERAGIAEELRARKQLLARLSDALPVGLLQFDTNYSVTFTNDRLQAIIGVPPAATVQTQLCTVIPDDRPLLATALGAALQNKPVDKVELRVSSDGSAADATTRVCELTLRALTDDDGNVTGAIGCISDVTDSVLLRRNLEIRASTDALTGCLNRAATLDYVSAMIDRCLGEGTGMMLAYLDVDEFKSINDRHGHHVGDDLLAALAAQLRTVLRDGDRVGRIGGDELLVVCPRVQTRTAAHDVARRIRAATGGSLLRDRDRFVWRASMGVSWSLTRVTPDELIAAADDDMYNDKRRCAQRRGHSVAPPRAETTPA